MSYLYTNEIAQRDLKMGNLVDIIDPVVIWDDSLNYYPYVVSNEEAMRPDIICFNIYGNFNYIDEFLTYNNILNPWSVKEGQVVYFLDEDSLVSLQLQAKRDDQEIVNQLVNPNKDTSKDPNRDAGTGLPPTIRPAGLKDVNVDYNNKTISIMDSFI